MESLENLIINMKQDKKYIDEREKERELKFKTSTESYLKSIKKEMETLKSHNPKIDKRNEEFRSQIRNIYYKYFTSSFHLGRTEKKLIEERTRFNEHFIKIYPSIAPEIREELKKENELLTIHLNKLREFNNNNVNPLHSYDIYRKEREDHFRLKNETKQRQKLYTQIQPELENLTNPKEFPYESHQKYLESFRNKYKDFKFVDNPKKFEDFSYQDKINYGKENNNIPQYYQDIIDKSENYNKRNYLYQNNPNQIENPKTNILESFIYNKKKNNEKYEGSNQISFPLTDKKKKNIYSEIYNKNENRDKFEDFSENEDLT